MSSSLAPCLAHFYNPNTRLGSAPEAGNALERWHAGHRLVFSLFAQECIALDGLALACRNGDEAAARKCLRIASRIFAGIATAFSVCGAMSPKEFSGVTDHMIQESGLSDISGMQSPHYIHLFSHTWSSMADAGMIEWIRHHLPFDHAEYVFIVKEWVQTHRQVAENCGSDRTSGQSLSGNQFAVISTFLRERILSIISPEEVEP